MIYNQKTFLTVLYWWTLAAAMFDLAITLVNVIHHHYGLAAVDFVNFGIQFGLCYYSYRQLSVHDKPIS
jgi:hypothetical protein